MVEIDRTRVERNLAAEDDKNGAQRGFPYCAVPQSAVPHQSAVKNSFPRLQHGVPFSSDAHYANVTAAPW